MEETKKILLEGFEYEVPLWVNTIYEKNNGEYEMTSDTEPNVYDHLYIYRGLHRRRKYKRWIPFEVIE